jgi:hypothetical protein
MIIAAQRAEFDFYQKGYKLGTGRFIGTGRGDQGHAGSGAVRNDPSTWAEE